MKPHVDTEQNYAQIEREALPIIWACDKFSIFIIGKNVEIEADHKLLVPLLSSKHLDTLPPRILRFRLRLGRYDYSILHVSGKTFLFTADALSRAPCCSTAEPETGITDADVESFVDAITSSVPVTKTLLEKHRMGQFKDPTAQQSNSFAFLDGLKIMNSPTHGRDLFLLKGCTYLLVVVYFSRYPEVIQLATTTSSKVIGALKSVFARHGIPEEVVSDNGPQFVSYTANILPPVPQQQTPSLAQFSRKDAEAFLLYEGWMDRMVQSIEPLLDSAPINLHKLTSGSLQTRLSALKPLVSLTKTGANLGKDTPAFLELCLAPASKILESWFESEPLKSTLATDAIIGEMFSPKSQGSG
ncbi:hypothetical protein EMCRGX_G029439 [Ephydatia muelleri]